MPLRIVEVPAGTLEQAGGRVRQPAPALPFLLVAVPVALWSVWTLLQLAGTEIETCDGDVVIEMSDIIDPVLEDVETLP